MGIMLQPMAFIHTKIKEKMDFSIKGLKLKGMMVILECKVKVER